MKDLRDNFYAGLLSHDKNKKLEACNRDSSHPAALYDVPGYRCWVEASKKYDVAYKVYTSTDVYKAYKKSYNTLSTSGPLGQIEFYNIRTALVNSEARKVFDDASKEWGIAYKIFKDAETTYKNSNKYKELIDSRKESFKEPEKLEFKQILHLIVPRRKMMERTLSRYSFT